MSTRTTADRPPRGGLSRRQLLAGAVALTAAGGASLLGVELSSSDSPTSNPTGGVDTSAALKASSDEHYFYTRTDLVPPRVKVSRKKGLTPPPAAAKSGPIIVTPSVVPGARASSSAGLGQAGVLILDTEGEILWFHPTDAMATNAQVQTLDGKPVLTYWVGQVGDGVGYGEGHVLDTSYRQIATVKAGNGLKADLHELTLTPQGTALISAYRNRKADLTSVGGKKDGVVLDSVVQEVELNTGKVLFEWRALDHVDLTESYAKPGSGAFDFFHINSIGLVGDSELLVSARNTWALYRLNRQTGAVISRLNGKKSDYVMGPKTRFAWQHHARIGADGTITLFDDEAAPAEGPASRGLALEVDDAKRTVKLAREYIHPAKLLAGFEGSMQALPTGNVFIGWGGEPYFSEFDADGELVLDGRFPTNDQSYRAFRYPWSGTPIAPPDIVAVADALGSTAVYVSWNGATDVHHWEVLSGKSDAALASTVTVPHTGFETAITVRPKGSRLAVAALDANGKQLGISKTITVKAAA